jgi:hypothetical protein
MSQAYSRDWIRLKRLQKCDKQVACSFSISNSLSSRMIHSFFLARGPLSCCFPKGVMSLFLIEQINGDLLAVN